MRPVLPLLTRALLPLTRATSLLGSTRDWASISSESTPFTRGRPPALAKPHESLLVIDERGGDAIAGAARLVTQHDGVLFLRGVLPPAYGGGAWAPCRRAATGSLCRTEASFTCAFDDVPPLHCARALRCSTKRPRPFSPCSTRLAPQRRKHSVSRSWAAVCLPLRPVQDADSGALEGRGAAPATADDRRAPRH